MSKRDELIEIINSLPSTAREIRERWDEIQWLLSRTIRLAREMMN